MFNLLKTKLKVANRLIGPLSWACANVVQTKIPATITRGAIVNGFCKRHHFCSTMKFDLRKNSFVNTSAITAVTIIVNIFS